MSVPRNAPLGFAIQVGLKIGDQPGDRALRCAGRPDYLRDECCVRRDHRLAWGLARADSRLEHAGGQAAARPAHHQFQGQRHQLGRWCAAEQRHQRRYRSLRHLFHRLPDGGERRQDGPALVIVVEPDHGHIFGHEDAARLERLERAARHIVAHGDDGVEVELGPEAARVEEIRDRDRAVAAIPVGVTGNEFGCQGEAVVGQRVPIGPEAQLLLLRALGPAQKGDAAVAMMLDQVTDGIPHPLVVVDEHAGDAGKRAADGYHGQRAEAPAESFGLRLVHDPVERAGPDDQPIHRVGADQVIEGIGRGVSRAGRREDAAVETDEVGSERVRGLGDPHQRGAVEAAVELGRQQPQGGASFRHRARIDLDCGFHAANYMSLPERGKRICISRDRKRGSGY